MTRVLGKSMILVAWVLGLGLLTWLFSGLLDEQRHPNRDAREVRGADGARELVLRRNRAGHYLAPGYINGQPVTFLVDTGASDVAIPQAVAQRLGLPLGRPGISRTAGGDVRTWSTLLRSVAVGGMERHGVRATILPDMEGEEVLLGMSYLKGLELVQRGNTLTLRGH